MLALLPLLLQLAGSYGPTLTKMLLGQKAGDVVGTIVKVAKEVFGSDDPAEINNMAKSNPDLVSFYIERVKAETEQYKAALLDVADAREQTVTLVQAGSVIAWGAPTVSIIVTLGFVTVLLVWMMHPPSSDPLTLTVLNILVGALGSSFTSVVSYWLGSSMGSKQKDDVISAALIGSQSNTKSAIQGHK